MYLQDLLDKYRISTSSDKLLERWTEPHRCYHGITHLQDLAKQINDAVNAERITEKQKELLLLIALFHDIIYDPTRQDNEERSAEFFMSLCADKTDPDILSVQQAILDTKTHVAQTGLSKIFNEMDMNIVERSFDELLDWEKGIRAEYNMFNSEMYKQGRLQFLHTLPAGYPLNEVNLNRLIDWVVKNY